MFFFLSSNITTICACTFCAIKNTMNHPLQSLEEKHLSFFDFMKWHTFKYGKGVFTYPDDWNGFNIPGDTINKVWQLGITHKSIYDYETLQAWNKCNTNSKGDKFYIIGAVKNSGALNHWCLARYWEMLGLIIELERITKVLNCMNLMVLNN